MLLGNGRAHRRSLTSPQALPQCLADPALLMDLKIISRLVRIMTRGDVTELELDEPESGLRIKLRRGPDRAAESSPVVHVLPGAAPGAVSAALPSPGAAAAEPGGAGHQASASDGTKPFTSPMVGTFYRAQSPDADPFVSAGSRIDEETVVCIIEAMKVMNEVKAECTGEVVQVLVENGEPVEYGQPLFLYKAT